MPAKPWIKVVEADSGAKNRPNGGIFITLAGAEAGTEPLGDRIIETPVNADDTEIRRNPRSGFIAYVPTGSLKKGEALVNSGTTAGGGKVTARAACHGADLRGLGPVPRLAGRPPGHIARQAYDMQHGGRGGTWTPPIAPAGAHPGDAQLFNAA